MVCRGCFCPATSGASAPLQLGPWKIASSDRRRRCKAHGQVAQTPRVWKAWLLGPAPWRGRHTGCHKSGRWEILMGSASLGVISGVFRWNLTHWTSCVGANQGSLGSFFGVIRSPCTVSLHEPVALVALVYSNTLSWPTAELGDAGKGRL